MAGVNVGLALRTHAVEVVEARRTLSGVAMTKYVRVPIAGPEDLHIVSAIKTALTTAQINPVRIGVTVPAHEVFLRSFVLPHLPRAEWATAVQFEARKYIPFHIEELVWDFHAVEDRQTKQLNVIFAGIRAETFARIQGWLRDAGVEPAWVEAPWLSLARVAGITKKMSPNDCIGVVDVEPGIAHVVIVKDRLPYLARDINLGSVAGGAGSSTQPLDPQAEKLLSELRLSFDFFTREYRLALVSRVVLFGDAATLEPWCSWLSAQLHCPVDLGALPLTLKRRESADLSFVLAASVASRELRPSVGRLDFVERAPLQAGPAKAKALDAAALLSRFDLDLVRSLLKPALVQAGLAGALLLGLQVLVHQQLRTTEQQIANAVQALPDVGWGLKGAPRAELQAIQPVAERRLAFLRKTVQERLLVSKKLEVLAKTLPEGIWLEGVTYKNPLGAAGAHQAALMVRGACYLPQSGNELKVISDFAQRIKQEQDFFRGFTTSQLGQIAQAHDDALQATYRTFQLNYRSERGMF